MYPLVIINNSAAWARYLEHWPHCLNINIFALSEISSYAHSNAAAIIMAASSQ